MKTDLQITLDNLTIVLDKLPKLAEEIPSIKTDFEMMDYGCYEDLPKEAVCNTHGCLLGNIARILPRVDKCYVNYSGFNYGTFGVLYFPFVYIAGKYQQNAKDWNFLFGAEWSYHQPTFEQAMERVKYFIDCEGEIGVWEYREESFIKD